MYDRKNCIKFPFGKEKLFLKTERAAMTRITLRQCAYFQAVARKGGIAAAAETAGVSQPAIAQAITKLEDLTGLVLFRRLHARGMELTPQGREFLRHADQLLALADQMDMAVEDIAQQRRGTLRLGCFQSLAPFFLAQILTGYQRQAPDVVLNLSEMLQEELTTALQENELDLAILYDLGLDARLFNIHPLAEPQPYLIVPQGHPLAGQDRVSIRALDGEDFVLFDAPQSREYFHAQFAHHEIKPRIAYRSASIETVRSYVANGLGLSILSMRPVSDLTYEGKSVVPVALTEGFGATPIVIATRAGVAEDALLAPLIAFCQELFAELYQRV
ncbi:transcriptional regulator, LysR family protein [Roseobacter sp. SK209-2-6]|nr:transcriptional regulator, LysR family protein [Roseobacter sp. SK209-2-6]